MPRRGDPRGRPDDPCGACVDPPEAVRCTNTGEDKPRPYDDVRATLVVSHTREPASVGKAPSGE